MAKKKETKIEVKEPQAEEVQVKEPQVEKVQVEENIIEEPYFKDYNPLKVTEKKESDVWEIKNRVYYLKRGKKPLSKMIRSANIFYFDEEKGYERELKYCENQRTCFVDEMKGDQRLSHIVFRNGALTVPREKVVLQQLLSLYHPHRDKIYEEWKPVKIAEDQVDIMELEVDALIAARNMDIDLAEAVMRAEIGSKVSNLSSKELKRDLLVFAKRNPRLFLELASDDNVVLRNFGIKATEHGIIKLSSDQRNFLWGSNDRKLMTVPFDEHPYTALAHWFKTDEGMEIYANIEKRLK